MPEKQGRVNRFLTIAVLLLVLAVGVVIAAVLAHELLRRQHEWLGHQPAVDLRLQRPDGDSAPSHPPPAPYHHHRRAPLTAGNAATASPAA